MSPLAPGTIVRITSAERGLIAIRLTARGFTNGECLEWLGGQDSSGYGKCSFRRKTVPVHRLAHAIWNVRNGIALPPHVHHRCDNGLCFRPEHLAGVTVGENNSARVWKESGDYICLAGHVNPKLYVRGQRRPKCAGCHRQRQREYEARRRHDLHA